VLAKRFFVWLAGQPGYRSLITYADAEYFNLSAKDTRIAKATRPARVPTLEQIRHVVRSMPASTDIERRGRALIAFTILTGARDGAIASSNRAIDFATASMDCSLLGLGKKGEVPALDSLVCGVDSAREKGAEARKFEATKPFLELRQRFTPKP
jgi:hypothetical protein